MSKFFISFSIVVFLFLPSILSQEKEVGEDGVDESTSPVIASIKGKAEASIAKIGWRLMREVDGKVIYEVQLRQRIEGKVGDWRHEAETAKTYVLVDGLKPNTTYDVRIRGWIGGKAGKWKIHENAFKTSSEQGDGEGREDGGRDEDEDGEGENGDRDKDKGGEGEDGEREGDEGDGDRDDDDQDWESDGGRGEEDEDWFKDVPDDVLTEIKRIKSAFAAGEISEDKAEAKIDELLGTIKDDDVEEWEDAEKGESSIMVNGEGLISDIPIALIEPLLKMMAAIDWNNISDWIQVGLEIDQLFGNEWDEGGNLEVKKKMKNQIIGDLKSSPQTLIKDLSKQANNKSASAELKYELTIRSGSGILIMKFEGHLQTAPTPIGPWTDIEATESFEVQADIGSAFFRSKK
jgi:hypothetical protein